MAIRFSDFVTLQRGFDLTKTDMQSGPFPVIGSTSIIGYHDKFKVEPPGVVIGRSGSLGTVQLVTRRYWPHNTSLWVKDFKGNDPRFVYYCLQGMDFTRFNAGAGVPTLNRNHLDTLEVEIPTLPVQQRIAGILSAYDELIENSQRRASILEAMARAVYCEWFVDFRFSGDEKVSLIASALGEIPAGWIVRSIEQFGAVITGKTPSKDNAAFYGDDMPFVKTPDMNGNMFILDTNDGLSTAGAGSQANKTLPAGSICVTCIGTIGTVSITTEACQTNQQINSVKLADPACREFLFFRLRDAKRRLENLGSNCATMANVNKAKFATMEVVCPPDDILARYHVVVAPMFAQILHLAHQVQNLRKTRDLLLPRLLSGQIDVEAA